MKYPSSPASHEWYMYTMAGYHQDDIDNTSIKSVFLTITKQGASGSYNLGYVKFDDKDFIKSWFSLVAEGKKIIDAINFSPDAVEEWRGQCANCDQGSLENDFLCAKCRNAEPKEIDDSNSVTGIR